MSAVDIEYKKRGIKFHFELYLSVNANFDTSLIQKFLQSNMERLLTEYIANENTGMMIDQIIARKNLLTK